MELHEKGTPVQQVPVGGIGFVFDGQPDADGLVFAGVDFDKVISGRKIASLAEERIRRLGSYTERSVSGGGFHVIVKARPLASGIVNGGVEMYTSGRFFTMTGRAPENARIVAAPVAFAALVDEIQTLGGDRPMGGSDAASASGQSNFTAADREYLQGVFGTPNDSLSDGIETNIEEIRSAVSAIPPSAISSEADWMTLARAMAHEAAVHKSQSEELWEILDSASRPAPGYNAPDNRARWLRLIGEAFAREKPITIATMFDLAKKHGWRGRSPIEEANPETPVAAIDPASFRVSFGSVPHRQWLYGIDLVRSDITVVASPGGFGKTSLALGMAISIATGKELLEENITGGELTALYINAEDSGDEMLRRAFAFCLKHGVAERDLARLLIAGIDHPQVRDLSFLQAAEKQSALDLAGFNRLGALLEALRPDLLVLDPLTPLCGGGNTNDNAVMSLVFRALKGLAIKYSCAILIVHHNRKGGEPGSAEAVSGAAAITNAARRAIMPVPMSVEEATQFGVLPSQRLRYIKVVDAKSNLVPRSADSPWYELHSIELPNAEPPHYRNGDNVQAIARIAFPTQPAGNPDDLKTELAIVELVERGKEIDGQAYPYSASLAGAKNQRALLPDAMVAVLNALAPRHWAPGDLEATIKITINKMLTDGRLVDLPMEDLMPKPGRFRRARGLKAVPI
jgi:hypothetical protein